MSWKYLNRYGYTLLKVGDDGLDTLAYAMKPLSKEQMLAKYTNPRDSLAAMAMELTWGNGRMKYNQTRAVPGSVEQMLEMSEEQNMMFGFAVLISEWRPDLADDLALRFTDRKVTPGHHYQYILQPTRWDPDSSIIFSPGFIENIENTRYAPTAFQPYIQDSLTSAYGVVLQWPMDKYSSFEVERRDTPAEGVAPADGQVTGTWRRMNTNPLVPLLQEDFGQSLALFSDALPVPGRYEYRIMAHDMFGDLTAPSPVHTVTLTDKNPPLPARLKVIYIDRPEDDPAAKVLARIYWVKDTLEEDLTGFLPMYYNKRVTGEEWKKLLAEPLPAAQKVTDSSALPFELLPGETAYMCTVDVTELRTGMVTIASYDRAGNMSVSMPQQLRVEDMRPPEAPRNLTARVYEDGVVLLSWNSAGEDVAYYQVAFANDTTHIFQILNEGGIQDTTYTDTLAVDINQKYIYYKVRATDYATNEGEWSAPLRVVRPTLVPPTVAHLDSAWVCGDSVNTRWIAGTDATITHHVIYRQLQGAKDWQVIQVCDGDSVKAQGNKILVSDTPEYNRSRRYRYAVETFNSSGISSGKSLIYSILHRGPVMVDADINLMGDYISDSKETRLAWDVKSVGDDKGDYYFAIYRKAPGEEIFRFVTTTEKDNPMYEDVLPLTGEPAEYYVKIYFKDGRRSQPSNTVKILHPSE